MQGWICTNFDEATKRNPDKKGIKELVVNEWGNIVLAKKEIPSLHHNILPESLLEWTNADNHNLTMMSYNYTAHREHICKTITSKTPSHNPVQ